MKIEEVAIDCVIPYVRNPRKGGATAKVAASLKEFGWKQPIVVDGEMVVIAGHTRLEAARTLGLKNVPVLVARDLVLQPLSERRGAIHAISPSAAAALRAGCLR